MVGEKIVVLGTGGTIAGVAPDPARPMAYTAGQLGVTQLLAAVPALRGLPLVTEEVAQIDSKDMAPPVWQALARRCAYWLASPGVRGLVITHGTDTLEETAYFLQRVLSPSLPVVLTCAMRPATAPDADGPRNLQDAVRLAMLQGAHGVLSVCAGRVHGPWEVAKVHPLRLDAFDSDEAGPLALLEGDQVRQRRPWPAPGASDAPGLASAVDHADPAAWPWVEIVQNHAGADGRAVDALVAQGVRGLVAAGTGNGTLAEPLAAAFQRAHQAGVAVVLTTRCAQGRVSLPPGDERPEVSPLPPVKARIELQLQLLSMASGGVTDR